MGSLKSFEIGDIVILKSGGPHMTVTDSLLNDEKLVGVRWFDKEEAMHFDVFNAPELVKYGEKENG